MQAIEQRAAAKGEANVWLQDAIDVATHQIHALVDELVIITKVKPGRLRRRAPSAMTDRAVFPR